jgi:hypothetical protein
VIDKLTVDDCHHWGPSAQVLKWLIDGLPPEAKVLEIGPGYIPFPRATTFVDFAPKPELARHGKVVTCDLAVARLPFAAKQFDFVYCRHVLEDMYSPFLLCAEMARVAHAGYIETPSPIAELCRGVDGSAPVYRGYHHHRYFVWSRDNELCFLAKYPLIEHMAGNDALLVELLRRGAAYWNTYHAWSGHLRVRHLQNTLDFDMVQDYGALLERALREGKQSIDAFWRQIERHDSAAA